MKPGSFATLLLALVLLGGAGGAALGYALHEPNPYSKAKPETNGIATTVIQGIVGTETLNAAYEGSRRRWAATGLAGGAVLGLLYGATVGSYSLRYRKSGP